MSAFSLTYQRSGFPSRVRLAVVVEEHGRVDLAVADQRVADRVGEGPGGAVRDGTPMPI
jgi:hypothetical protein